MHIPLNCVSLLCKSASPGFEVSKCSISVITPLRGYLVGPVDMYTQENTHKRFLYFIKSLRL